MFAVVETAGLPFLVMEYVPGGSLQDRIDRQGPLGLIEILRIGMQTAAGLAASYSLAMVEETVREAAEIFCKVGLVGDFWEIPVTEGGF